LLDEQKLGAPVLCFLPPVVVPLQSAPKVIRDSEEISGFLYFFFELFFFKFCFISINAILKRQK